MGGRCRFAGRRVIFPYLPRGRVGEYLRGGGTVGGGILCWQC